MGGRDRSILTVGCGSGQVGEDTRDVRCDWRVGNSERGSKGGTRRAKRLLI